MTPAQEKLLKDIDRRGRAHTFVFALIVVWLAALSAKAWGQDLQRVMRADDAVAAALRDAESLAAVDPAFPARMRYVMSYEFSPAIQTALNYAGNQVLNFGGDTSRPQPFAGGTLYRIDLFLYADKDPARFKLLADTWDRIEDRQFYAPTDKFRLVSSPRYRKGGVAYASVYTRNFIPEPTANVNGALDALIGLTTCQVPIVSYGQALKFLLSASEGLYPEFRQIDQAPKQGTAEDAFLFRVGITPQTVAKIKGDQRAVLISNVTGNWRVIEYYWSSITRGSVGPSLVTITRDWKRGRIEPNVHGLENLAQDYAAAQEAGKKINTHDATEILQFKSDGGMESGLFDGVGAYLREAPANNVVADRVTVPAPHPPSLDAGIKSCMGCHGPQWAMFQPAANYVSALRNMRIPVARPDGGMDFVAWDVFAEQGDQGRKLQRVVSLFKGETVEPFATARITHARFAMEAVGVKIETAAEITLQVYNEWNYAYVTPRKALLTLGYRVGTEREAVDTFNRICPIADEPLRLSLFRGMMKQPDGSELPPQMTMDDWQELFAETMLRVQAWEAANPPQKKEPVP